MDEFSNYEKLINSEAFKNASNGLSAPFGETENGKILVQDMKKIGHMLVSGAAGCGKTTFVQSLLMALIENHGKEDLRLCLCDTKGIDYNCFNGIPHLYAPVVSDSRRAAGLLQWCVVEIEKRAERARQGKFGNPPESFIVVDDFASVINIEGCQSAIMSILNKGHRFGVHLILVTGAATRTVIRDEILASTHIQISFIQPTAQMSVRAIGKSSAEKLQPGEILVAERGTFNKYKPLCMSFDEISQHTKPIINSVEIEYTDEILEEIEKAANPGKSKEESIEPDYDDDNPFAGCDALLTDAVDVVLDVKQASTSMLQRRLKLGYSRASRLMDEMEELGIIGPPNGSSPREILVTKESWQEWKMSKNTSLEQFVEDSKDDFEKDESAVVNEIQEQEDSIELVPNQQEEVVLEENYNQIEELGMAKREDTRPKKSAKKICKIIFWLIYIFFVIWILLALFAGEFKRVLIFMVGASAINPLLEDLIADEIINIPRWIYFIIALAGFYFGSII